MDNDETADENEVEEVGTEENLTESQDRSDKTVPVEETEEDWNFDFSMYDQEEDDEEQETEAIVLKKVPQVQIYRSRWSNWDGELQRLTELNKEASKRAIKVSARSQDIQDLYNLFGIIEEMWAILKPLQGSIMIDEIEKRIDIIIRLLRKYQKSSNIPDYVYSYLLSFRDLVYKIKQFTGLGFEVQKGKSGTFQRAKERITG